jgi:sn-glycerol 3-phosphate transport system permease protein
MAIDTLTPVDSQFRGLTAPRQEHPGRRARTLKSVAWYVTLTALSVVVLFPVYMTLIRALSAPLAYVQQGQPLYPVDPEWDVFSRAFSEGDLGRHLLLSAVVTIIITAGQLVTSVLAAYTFAFLRFPLKRTMFVVFIATLMLPVEVTLIANVRTIRDLDWLNSLQGLTVPFLATAFGTFLIRQGFLGIPRDIRDASQLDGFGDFAFLRRVAVPLTRPIIASFTLIAFLSAWNQYLWPRAVTTEADWATVQIALQQVAAQNIDETNIGFAAAIIAAVPILLLLIVFQRHLIRGLTAGAVKG